MISAGLPPNVGYENYVNAILGLISIVLLIATTLLAKVKGRDE
ncbi:hypothetical protein ES703_88910 [subsurface metagenome]